MQKKSGDFEMALELESRAILNNFPVLVDGIKHAVPTISVKCLQKNLITQDIYDSTSQVNRIDAKHASSLLGNIRSNVERKPRLFEDFVTILEESPSLEDIGKRLRDELSQLKQEPELHQETEQHKERHRRTISTTPTLTSPITPIGRATTGLKNVLEDLHSAKLEQKENEARIVACEAAIEEKETRITNLKVEIGQVKQESSELKEETKKYAETNHELGRLLTEKREKIHQLESKLSEKEKQIYNVDKQTGKHEKQVTKLQDDISQLLGIIIQLYTDVKDIDHRRKEVQKLLSEAEKESDEFDYLEAFYEAQCEQLEEKLRHEQTACQHMHTTLQEKIRTTLKVNRLVVCILLAVVVVFAIINITFGYCLEDKVNRNIKQCAETVFSKVTESLY